MKHFILAIAMAALPVNIARADESAPSSTRLPIANAAAQAPSSADIQSVAARVKPSLVRIHVVESSVNGGREQRSESFGSGAIISSDGYVVTNHHVAGDALWLRCTLSDRREVEAKLIGTDPLSDIAVIKLEASGAPYPTASWGDSSTLRVGDPVLALGSPLALSQSVTAGIVANTELVQSKISSEFNLDGENVGSIVRWIGHDALIQPGNSGGPLVNLSGEIIGINEVSMGLSGAIPGNLAREVTTQIIALGYVERAFTGLDLQPRLDEDKRESGVLVGGVWPGSPAEKAGIKPGDLLLSANAQALNAQFAEQLPLVNLQLGRLPIANASTVTLRRGEQTLDLSLSPVLRQRNLSQQREIKGWGLGASDITDVMAKEYRLSSTEGVLVWSVQDGGPAGSAKPPLEEADVIVSVAGKPINNLQTLRDITSKIARVEDGTPTLVEVRRHGERVLLVVNVNSDPSDDTSVEVATSYFPVSTQVVTRQLAQALKLPSATQGVRITQIHPDSAAQKAGFRVGDIITRLDNDKVEAVQPEDNEVFAAMIRQYKIGSTAKVAVLRNGKPMTISMSLPRAPKAERELAVYRDENFGLSLRDVTYSDRLKQNAAPDANGALVTSVQSGSWAALAGLQANDIIHKIDGTTVRNMSEARAILRAMEKSRPRHAVFFVTRNVRTLYVEAQTDWAVQATP
jgi:serine protease Do